METPERESQHDDNQNVRQANNNKKNKRGQTRLKRVLGDALPSFLGTLAGGIIALSTLLFQFGNERQKIMQQWFDDTYLEEGVDPLISQTLTYIIQLPRLKNNFKVDEKDRPPQPIKALSNIQILLNDESVSAQISVLYPLIYETSYPDSLKYILPAFSKRLNKIHDLLVELRKEILSFEIEKEKKQMYEFKDHKNVQELIKKFRRLNIQPLNQ